MSVYQDAEVIWSSLQNRLTSI